MLRQGDAHHGARVVAIADSVELEIAGGAWCFASEAKPHRRGHTPETLAALFPGLGSVARRTISRSVGEYDDALEGPGLRRNSAEIESGTETGDSDRDGAAGRSLRKYLCTADGHALGRAGPRGRALASVSVPDRLRARCVFARPAGSASAET